MRSEEPEFWGSLPGTFVPGEPRAPFLTVLDAITSMVTRDRDS